MKPLRRLSELKQWVESTRKALFPWKSKTASLKRLEVDDNDSGDFALFFVFFMFLGVVVFFFMLKVNLNGRQCFFCAVFFVLRKKLKYGKFQIKTSSSQVWVSGNTVCVYVCTTGTQNHPFLMDGGNR